MYDTLLNSHSYVSPLVCAQSTSDRPSPLKSYRFGTPVMNADWTAAPASISPAPHSAVVQLHANHVLPVGSGFGDAMVVAQAGPLVWNGRAVVWIFASTCAGVSAGFADSISDAIPATCGVAMLVPEYCT